MNVILKPKQLQTFDEDKLASVNLKALYAIFTMIDPNQLRLIFACESAKEAWDILEIAYEGMNTMKLSKLQMLITRFEELWMHDDEIIDEFNAKLCDIVNDAHALCKKIPKDKLVRKTLRLLSERFTYKVTII